MGTSKELDVMLGNPRKAILAMAGPLVISYLIIQINTFMDLSWCSGLGSSCTSAVASISPMLWISAGLGTGIGVGAAAAIASKLGVGRQDEANSVAVQTLVVTLALSLFVTVVSLSLIDPLIDMMNVRDIRSECHTYIEPMLIGSVGIVFNGVITGLLRGEGASRRSTYVLIIAALTHMALDPILIYGLGMGLAGASVATVVGMSLGAAVGLSWYVRGRMVVKLSFRGYRPKTDEIILVLGVGIPRTIEILIISMMSMIQRVFVVQCGGTEASMFYNLPWNLVSLTQSVSMSLGAALIPICSAAIAMGLIPKAKDAYMYAMKCALAVLIMIAVVIFIFADIFVLPFTYSESMAAYRPEFVHVVRIYMFLAPCMGIIDVSSSMLQAMRRAQLSMISAFIRNLAVVLMLMWAATVSLDAIYWSVVGCELFGAVLMAGFAHISMSKLEKGPAVGLAH